LRPGPFCVHVIAAVSNKHAILFRRPAQGTAMPEHVAVKCPSCSQEYQVTESAVGHKARCRKCLVEFVISTDKPTDEDTIIEWITQDAPAATSTTSSTGVLHGSHRSPEGSTDRSSKPHVSSNAHQPGSQVVHLMSIGDDGAHFEFPAAALTGETLRNSFPRKCAGCCTRTGLQVHLAYWPERMVGVERTRWRELVDGAVGDLERFTDPTGPGLLRQLPRPRHVDKPFDLPFPIFACRHCTVSREVETHVVGKVPHEMCQMRIASLAVAVSFLRNNGGRGSHAYQRLIEQRDYRHDAWRELDPQIRQGLSQWFEPQAGERFVRFFRDMEFSPLQAQIAGTILTNHRLVFKLHTECDSYPLSDDGRIEIMRKTKMAIAHIYLDRHRPAVLKLDPLEVDELLAALRKLDCRWAVVT
jgi:hypothetical protein